MKLTKTIPVVGLNITLTSSDFTKKLIKNTYWKHTWLLTYYHDTGHTNLWFISCRRHSRLLSIFHPMLSRHISRNFDYWDKSDRKVAERCRIRGGIWEGEVPPPKFFKNVKMIFDCIWGHLNLTTGLYVVLLLYYFIIIITMRVG